MKMMTIFRTKRRVVTSVTKKEHQTKWEWLKELENTWGIDFDTIPIPEHRCPIFNGRVKLRQRKQVKRAQTRVKKLLQKSRNPAGKEIEKQLKENEERAKLNPEEITREQTKVNKIAYFAEWYKGQPETSETHGHECCGCCKWFPTPLVMIMQDRPDSDWQGFLPQYCFQCLRYGPGYWDYNENLWKSNFRKIIVHPSEFGHDKADPPEVKGQIKKKP